MYKNIGNKIKCLAKFLFAIETIGFLIGGFTLASLNEDLLAISLILIFCGPLIAWISSWILYGYGQLIENTDIIAHKFNTQSDTHQKTDNERIEKQPCEKKDNIDTHIQNREEEYVFTEEDFVDINCPNCEAKLSFTKEQLQNNNNLKCPACDNTISV